MKLKQIRVDGYRNLIKCVVKLGDFNVLVGPNNSGKSSLLEAIQMLYPICFGDDKLRENIFLGMPLARGGSSICDLDKYRAKPLTIGVSFEVSVNDTNWLVDYDVAIQGGHEKKENIGFLTELLTAKEPSKTGPPKTYIKRVEKELEVCGKSHSIAKDNSSLLAIRSLYADFINLPPEFEKFVQVINAIGNTDVFAVSPRGLRSAMFKEKPIEGLRVSSFDLPFAVDKIKEKGKYYELFKESLCDIIELEDVRLQVEDISISSRERNAANKTLKRVRLLFVKRKGAGYSLVQDYSDGTFAVAAILAVLLSEGDKEPIICIEEPENYLHPAALGKLLRFLQDHADKWPILITTHSPYLLNGVNPEDVNVAVVDETVLPTLRK